MLLYRVFPHLPGARAGQPGHATFVPRPQGRGRIDNPAHYDAWYFGFSPETAIGETFGDLPAWSEEMFAVPGLPGSRRALAVAELDDDRRLLNMDDPNALLHLGLTPTQVITRNRQTTQAWALAAFREGHWAGLRWWSFHRPEWTVAGVWQRPGERPPHRVAEVRPLSIVDEAVVNASQALARPLR